MTPFLVSFLLFAAVPAAGPDWPAIIEDLLAGDAPSPDWRPFAPYRDRPPPEDAPRWGNGEIAWWRR